VGVEELVSLSNLYISFLFFLRLIYDLPKFLKVEFLISLILISFIRLL